MKHLIVTALLFLATLLPAYAYDFEVDGIYYNITGSATASVTKASKYGNDYSSDVVIPQSVNYEGNSYTVTAIGDSAFYSCANMTSVIIPETVTIINARSFAESGITTISIPNSVAIIGVSAFEGCQSLERIGFSSGLVSIYECAFENCNLSRVDITDIDAWCSIEFGNNPLWYAPHLYLNGEEVTDLVIPNTVTSIGSYSFMGCSGLTSVTIPNSVTTIGDGAFCGCYDLTSVDISNSVISIGDYAFSYCYELTSIDIPNSVTHLGDYAFYECENLENITIGNSVTYIGEDAFEGTSWSNNLPDGVVYLGLIVYKYNGTMPAGTSINLKDGTTGIVSSAFKGCSGLVSINLPNSVKFIGDRAFYDCINLASVQMSDSITEIGWRAFCGCSALESIVIPNSVTSYIGPATFYDCTALRTVTIGEGVTGIGNTAFRNCTSLDTINFNAISCADFSENNSSQPFYGLNLSVINIGDKVRHIPDYFAGGQTGLTSIAIGDAVESIGMYAFKNCTGLKSLTIGKAAATIKPSAFRGCTALDTLNYNAVNYPDITSVYQPWAASPFYELNFSIINIGEGVQRIPSYFAYQNKSLTDLNIPASLTEISDYAFYECSNLDNVVMADTSSLTRVLSYAFYNCAKMKLALTNLCGFYYVANYAFANCPGLTGDLIINYSVGESAFDGCSGLNSLTIGPRVSWLNSYYSFRGCTSLETLNFNAISCTNFSSTAEHRPFHGLNIRTIHIGDSVQRVPNYFAKDLSELTTLTIGKSVKEFGDSVFWGCSALETIDFNAVACNDFSVREYERPFSYLNFSRFNIGDDVQRIPGRLLYGVKAPFEMTIGRSVTSIGYSPFNSCPGVTSVSVSSDNPKYDSRNGCNAIIETASNTLVRGFRCSTVPGTVTAIADSAFCRCDSLTRLVIPNSVITIGNNAFNYCVDLEEVTFGNSLTTIGEDAFFWSGIKRIDLPNSVTTLGKSAFSNCMNATHITLSNGLTSICENAFYYCRSLQELSIPNSVTTIEEDAFAGCYALRVLTIPTSVTSIGVNAFCGHVDTLYYNAVSCDAFPRLFDNPFYGSGIKTIIIGDSVKDVPIYFAENQTKLTSLTIGNSVETIGWDAFYNCNKLTTVTIPS